MPRRPSPNHISAPYGWRTHPITGVREFHTGEDISSDGTRTLVMPITGTLVNYEVYGGYGQLVSITSGNTSIRLGHTASLYPGVHVGQTLTEGTPVAIMGSTGTSTGPHVHWEVLVNNVRQDPAEWLANQTKLALDNASKLIEQENTKMLLAHILGGAANGEALFLLYGPNFYLEFTGQEAANGIAKQLGFNSVAVSRSYFDAAKRAANVN